MSVSAGLGVNEKADSLSEDDEVLINDRDRTLTVTGRGRSENNGRYRPDERDHKDVVWFRGNGTRYRMVWTHGSGYEPILRSRSEWDEEDGEPVNFRAGERVHSLVIVSETGGGSNDG